jgi:hypothetical protein
MPSLPLHHYQNIDLSVSFLVLLPATEPHPDLLAFWVSSSLKLCSCLLLTFLLGGKFLLIFNRCLYAIKPLLSLDTGKYLNSFSHSFDFICAGSSEQKYSLL